MLAGKVHGGAYVSCCQFDFIQQAVLAMLFEAVRYLDASMADSLTRYGS
jgi:hypothetical protein